LKKTFINKIVRINKNLVTNNEKLYKLSSINEWYQSVYYYNSKQMFNVDIKDKLTNYIINSYFNSTPDLLNKITIKRKRLSLKRIFISKSEIKHSIDNIFITIYTFNKQKKLLLNSLKGINKMFINQSLHEEYMYKMKNNLKTWIFIIKYTYKGILSNGFLSENKKINLFLYYINKTILQNNTKDKKVLINIIKNIINNKFIYIYLYQYYTTMLYINNIKFNISNLLGMTNILNKLYNKKITINIINLKYIFMDNSLLIDGIVRKVRDRKKQILTVIRKVLAESRKCILSPWLLIPNIYKNISNEDLDLNNKFVVQYQNYKTPLLETYKYNILNYIYNNNKVFIIKDLKYKFLRGVFIQGSGRLTKRLTASRSINKKIYKGNLQNIYSTYQGIPSSMLRNDIRCNIQYLNINSKNRNGSFGIKSSINSY